MKSTDWDAVECNADMQSEAEEILSSLDLDGDERLVPEDIYRVGFVDDGIVHALYGALDMNADGHVDLLDIQTFLSVLFGKDNHAKVSILFKLLGANSNGDSISFDQLQSSLKVKGSSIFELLGFTKEGLVLPDKLLTVDDLYILFRNSKCGEEALNSFCMAIHCILRKQVIVRRDSTHRSVHLALQPLSKANTASITHYFEVFGVWIVLQIFLWLYNFFVYLAMAAPLSICFAKAFGLNILVVTIFIFVTMAHSLKRALYGVQHIQPFIPLQSNIEVHSFLGFSLFLHALGHTAGQLAYLASLRPGLYASVRQSSVLSGSKWYRTTEGEGKTGFILLFIIVVMTATSLLRGSSSFLYNLFRRCHLLYIAWLVLSIVHVPAFWVGLALAGFIFFLDCVYMTMNTTVSTLRTSRTAGNVSFLSIRKQASRPAPIPGSYYRIKVPSISPFEWHPFSLATSAASDRLTFMVDSVGDWTSALHKLILDPTRRNQATVQVQGPYVSICQHAVTDLEDFRPVVLVASGVGITPFLSVMATKVTDQDASEATRKIFAALFHEAMGPPSPDAKKLLIHRAFRSLRALDFNGGTGGPSREDAAAMPSSSYSSQPPSPQSPAHLHADAQAHSTPSPPAHPRPHNLVIEKEEDQYNCSILHLIWAIRDCSDLLFYVEFLHHLVQSQSHLPKNVVFIDVYLTGLGTSSDPSFLVSRTLFYLLVAQKAGEYLRIHFGRPDIDQCLNDLAPGAVYYCGGEGLMKSTVKACKSRGIKIFAEGIDSDGLTSKWVRETFLTETRRKREAPKEKPAGNTLDAAISSEKDAIDVIM